MGAVVFDEAGNLYGATQDGGSSSCHSVAQCGTVYQLAPPAKKGDPWTETVLHVFKGNASNDGASPMGGLVIDSAGNLYGTTAYGGTGNCVLLGLRWAAARCTNCRRQNRRVGHGQRQCCTASRRPSRGMLPQGIWFSTARAICMEPHDFGGGFGTTCNPFYQYCGAVFELSPPKTKGGKWTEKVLHGFKGGTDGANPNGGLCLDSKGAIYGTTPSGGNQSCKSARELAAAQHLS